MSDVITIREAAQRLGCSLSMAYRLWRRGELDGYTIGRKKLVFAHAIDAYREKHRMARPQVKPITGRVKAGLQCLTLVG